MIRRTPSGIFTIEEVTNNPPKKGTIVDRGPYTLEEAEEKASEYSVARACTKLVDEGEVITFGDVDRAKIHLNCYYPLTANKHYHPYDPALAAEITKAGQQALLELIEKATHFYADDERAFAKTYLIVSGAAGVKKSLPWFTERYGDAPVKYEAQTLIEPGNNGDFELKKRW
jgi:hypothetical protein